MLLWIVGGLIALWILARVGERALEREAKEKEMQDLLRLLNQRPTTSQAPDTSAPKAEVHYHYHEAGSDKPSKVVDVRGVANRIPPNRRLSR